MAKVSKSPALVVREMSKGRVTLSELSRSSGRPIQTLRNWTQNPDRHRDLEALVSRAILEQEGAQCV